MSSRLPLLLMVPLVTSCAGEAASPEPWTLSVTVQESGTDALLQAVSPVDGSVVWVSGHEATWALSRDGGESWAASVMDGEESLQFRDVEAFDGSTAFLMSAGPGEQSRIYRTDDGGVGWTLQYVADDPDAFLDCMAFWDRSRGLVFGDEVGGVIFILRTEDGGATWSRVPAAGLPVAQDGEGGFAASGTCLVTGGAGRAWVSAGNAEQPRALMTEDWGETWRAVAMPLVGGTGAGPTTIQMAADGRGITLGGVIGNDTAWTDNVAVTEDGGVSWSLAGRPVMPGPVYGSALVVEGDRDAVVAVGPRGMDWSTDLGATWQSVDTLTYWAVAFAHAGAGWAVGPGGRIVRLSMAGR